MSAKAATTGGKADVLNPRTTTYEFLGPLGTFVISLSSSAVVYALYFGCNSNSGGCPPSLVGIIGRVVSSILDSTWWKGLWDSEAALYYLGWYAFCVLAWLLLPGDEIEGTVLRTGGRKTYRMNGFYTFGLALSIACARIWICGPESFTFIYDKWVGFVTAALLSAILLATYCYLSSHRSGALLALKGNTGNIMYDWFIGRELNPSIGSLDLKWFNEVRPGLNLWAMINISMLCKQAVLRGGFQNVTNSMWLVVAFQVWYVADCMLFEPAVLTTMDITTDGFGFMLSLGDLVWVPFTYSIQARYLVFRPIELQTPAAVAIFILNAAAYWIFRDSNNEKNDFRNGKNPKNLKYLPTKRGTKLLISGWWGLSQHPNYLGDWLMSLTWCLPTGFGTPITYFYPIFFAILLLHRQTRDDEACHEKYGDDWIEYKKRVPYRIIPYIY
ncbi:ERG4 ERG24 ergosterol biosynthesis protein [Coprinopsis marcescibilis]|uniref:Delta(14)-sterol reductase ERG24 n=1 Tax=Coprinopsis marcescibilis TaxID=230819 RepID=A0A5C3L5Y7_COPMA|nr:ERG4 ERG24 ergosterol biosynthesis protein [Coprinopsis marcescibilis]